MCEERCEGEVVSQVRLLPIAQVGQVLCMWHVGLGNQDSVGTTPLQKIAQQTNQLMCFF